MNGLKILDCCKAKNTQALGGALALGLLAVAMAGPAAAGCADLTRPAGTSTAPTFTAAVYHPGGASAYAFLTVDLGGAHHGSIVGLWKVEFLAKGNTNGIPDGALIDYGTATWSSDGTETMISGGRQPANGDVCMGAWKQTGRDSFALNHLAMGYDGGAYIGPTSIKELVTLDPSGNSFHGTFTITAYLATQVPGHEFDQSTILAPTPIVGSITGTRVTAD
jgi:hypothetical protein